jgi:hypothetical protein
VLRASYRCTLVMPMTVWRRDYFADLASALRRVHQDLRCFCLTATEDVLRARILDRPPAEGPHDWCLSHLPAGLALMHDPTFGEEVATEGRDPEEVAEAILRALLNQQPSKQLHEE